MSVCYDDDIHCRIIDIETLLGSKEKIHETILREGMEIVEKYGSERKTQIVDNGKHGLRDCYLNKLSTRVGCPL